MKDLKVLVAEDEYLILMGLKSNLENLGCKVVGEATNGKELIKLALEKKPDMIIADINLPVMDGLEALRRINEKVFIPTLIVSGYDDEELIDKAKNLGVLGYLIKPIDESDLKAAIEIALSRFEEIKNLKNELEVTKETLESRKNNRKSQRYHNGKITIKRRRIYEIFAKKE